MVLPVGVTVPQTALYWIGRAPDAPAGEAVAAMSPDLPRPQTNVAELEKEPSNTAHNQTKGLSKGLLSKDLVGMGLGKVHERACVEGRQIHYRSRMAGEIGYLTHIESPNMLQAVVLLTLVGRLAVRIVLGACSEQAKALCCTSPG